jgi:hypothetical protein
MRFNQAEQTEAPMPRFGLPLPEIAMPSGNFNELDPNDIPPADDVPALPDPPALQFDRMRNNTKTDSTKPYDSDRRQVATGPDPLPVPGLQF